MVLKATTQLTKNKKANTHYIAIPAKLVTDSEYPFKLGEAQIVIKQGKMIITQGGVSE